MQAGPKLHLSQAVLHQSRLGVPGFVTVSKTKRGVFSSHPLCPWLNLKRPSTMYRREPQENGFP
jgi:hypothetical protein